MKIFEYKGNSQKISKYIATELPFLNYSSLQKLLRKGDIRINDKKIFTDSLISEGDIIEVYYKEETFLPKIVYEDENIVIYHKPIKLASDGEQSFSSKIANFVDKTYILCHRLDTNTEGLLLFAKNKEIFEIIKAAFKNHEINKYYLACVYGDIASEATLTDYLLKDNKESKVRIFKDYITGSKKIITKIKPLNRFQTHTYVEVELVTGKTHQIRAHLASIGHFVIGDGKYGLETINKTFKARTQALIAYKLIFNFSNKRLSYLNQNSIELKDIDNFFKY